MRTCPACHRENPDDTDFCQFCGEYLRWDPTVATPAVPRPSGPGPGPAQVPPGIRPIPPGGRGPADAVSITLRSLAEDVDPREGVRVAAAPGTTGTLVASIRNQSGIVDNYDLRLEGVPDDWWTITPATAYLVPYGAPSGRYEQDVQVQVHPPRTVHAEAREYPIRLVAGSRATGADAGSASARLTVQSYQEVETEMRPERAAGRRRAKFAFAVRNLANAPIEVEFSATDPEEKLKFAFKEKRGTARPGKRTGTPMIVKAGKTIWVGRPVDHPFQVAARLPGGEDAIASRQAVFRQRPWIAWWVPIAAVAAFGLGLAGYKLLQHAPTFAMPDLKGRSASGIQKYLENKFHLLLSQVPEKTKVVAANEVGKIVGQDPVKGFKYDLTHPPQVGLTVGVAATPVTVPPVCDMPFQAATQALKAAGLEVGQVQPAVPTDPSVKTLATGCSQPATAGSVAKGSPVSLFVAGPGGTAVPDVTQKSAADAASALQNAGFKTVTIPVLASAVAAGTVVAQKPSSTANLAKGATVYLYVSALPAVAYDDGTNIKVTSYAADGTPKTTTIAPPSGMVDIEPSWNADGTLIAFVQRPPSGTAGNGSIDVVAPDGTGQQLVASGADYHRPVFAPLAGSALLAFTQVPSAGATGGGALCFAQVASATAPGCVPDPTELLDRPTWKPDGTSIAAVASDPADPATPVGVRLFKSDPAFSTSPLLGATLFLSAAAPSFLAWSPPAAGVPQLAYATSAGIFVTPTVAAAGTSVFSASDPSAQLAFSWRGADQLAVGGQACSPTVPPAQITVVPATSGATTAVPSLGISGCNPAVQPLPAPPTS